MRKKPFVLFLFLIAPLVLPFLFYHAWRQEVVGIPEQDTLVRDSMEKNILSGETSDKEKETKPAITAVNSSVFEEQEKKTENEEMYDLNFWMERCERPRETIWTQEEIAVFNQQILDTEGMTYNIFSQEFRDTFQNEIFDIDKYVAGETKIQKWGEWGYGICVGRTEIKDYPVEEQVGEDSYFDQNLLTTARVNTPVLVNGQTEDGMYYHVISYDCQGWTLAENIALCSGKEEWEQAVTNSGWKTVTEDSEIEHLMVMVPRLRLEITGELLTMGTTMRLLTTEEAKKVMPMEEFYGCYVLASFGILFPRNSKAQSEVPAKQIVFQDTMEIAERKEILNQMNTGDILYFPGHIMFYLGQSEEEYYVLNAVGSMKYPGQTGELQNVRRVVINTLSMERKDGSSWLENMKTAILF